MLGTQPLHRSRLMLISPVLRQTSRRNAATPSSLSRWMRTGLLLPRPGSTATAGSRFPYALALSGKLAHNIEQNEDCDSVQCDGPCSRWYHAWSVPVFFFWLARTEDLQLCRVGRPLGVRAPRSAADSMAQRYHSSKDKRMPVQWTCFECRLKAHSNLRILQTDGDDAILLESYKNLATFRSVTFPLRSRPGLTNVWPKTRD
jgi:hypothetical protein